MTLKIVGFLLITFLIGAGVSAGYVKGLLQPVDPQSTETKMITIEKGESFSKIAKNLTNQGIIKSPWSLRIANYLNKQKKPIQAGSFRLSPAMSPEKVLEELAHGKIDMWVKILEGWRREEIADAIEKAFTDSGAKFNKQTFLSLTKSKEGYLFPDSYLVPLNTSEAAMVSLMETTLDKKINNDMKKAITKSGHSLTEIITMASIVEREARSNESRKVVAGILWRRISAGWPLQADATLQYAKGYDAIQKTWWKPPIGADKDVKSPYNTYMNTGLPPGPICSPSVDSISAAITPKETSYWFYLTDAQGGMHYAETLEQHNANIQKYLR